jgi:hypothetical protein
MSNCRLFVFTIGGDSKLKELSEDLYFLFDRGPVMHAPALELVQVACEECSHKPWKTTFSQSNPRALFHIVDRNVAHGKCTIAIAVAAIHGVFATVCIGSTTFFIPLHVHSAGLTVFVGSFHNSRFRHIQFTKFFGKLVTRLSTLFAQSFYVCRSY